MAEPSALDILARLLPSLGLIVGGLFLVRWWSARNRASSAGAVKVLARTGIAKGSVVAVIQVGGQRFLVGAAEQSVSLLSELPIDDPFDPFAPASPSSAVGPTDAATDVPSRRLARISLSDRPWMGQIHRLRVMTVRSHLERPVREHPAD